MASANNQMFNDNTLKLGLFSPNCSGGMAITKVPERWDASWENNLKLGQLADEVGIEFILPIARWIGYGGETDFQGTNLETITWCAGLLAATKRVSVFATAHTAFTHPIVAAKQFATIDHISSGRFGLNVVCGWNKPEYDMFGIELANDHETRYAFGQEWFDIVKKIWTSDEKFDWNSKYFNLSNVYGNPRPYDGVPPVMNAASSAEGRDFAARNADYLFTVLIDPEMGREDVKAIKALGKEKGRDIGVFTTCYTVCRPTRKEAEEFHEYYANENADWPAVDRLMELQGVHAQSFPKEAFALFRERFAGGHGVFPLVGSPDDVADGLAKVSEAGFSGTTLSFVDYVKELPYFAQEVLPRLEKKGLRQPMK